MNNPDSDARDCGFDPLTIQMETPDHKAYYPGAEPIHIRLTGDKATKRLLGVQLIGRYGAEISKRIDVIAGGFELGLSVADLTKLDL